MLKDIVVSTRIRLARNINNVLYPTSEKFKFDDAEYVINCVKGALGSSFNGFLINDNLKFALYLKEEHMLSSELIDANYGYLFFKDNKDIAVMVNEEDHIRIQAFSNELNFSNLLNIAKCVATEIEDKCDIAKISSVGYSTACPTNVGTGLRASAMLFLPALTKIGEMKRISQTLNSNDFVLRGYYGENSTASGFMYQISNKKSHGLSEHEIVKQVENIVLWLVDMEERARQKLLHQQRVELTDECMRAYGVLANCYKLASDEFFNLYALVKLGVQLNILKLNLINNLEINVQPAHLIEIYNKNMTDSERDILRAEYVSKILTRGGI